MVAVSKIFLNSLASIYCLSPIALGALRCSYRVICSFLRNPTFALYLKTVSGIFFPKKTLSKSFKTRHLYRGRFIKAETIIDQAVDNNIGFCVLTEKRLTNLDSVCITSLSSRGYPVKSFPRQSDRPGGGTGILVHDSFVALFVAGKEHDSFKFSDWIFKACNR